MAQLAQQKSASFLVLCTREGFYHLGLLGKLKCGSAPFFCLLAPVSLCVSLPHMATCHLRIRSLFTADTWRNEPSHRNSAALTPHPHEKTRGVTSFALPQKWSPSHQMLWDNHNHDIRSPANRGRLAYPLLVLRVTFTTSPDPDRAPC